jgi:hypothetical protein
LVVVFGQFIFVLGVEDYAGLVFELLADYPVDIFELCSDLLADDYEDGKVESVHQPQSHPEIS